MKKLVSLCLVALLTLSACMALAESTVISEEAFTLTVVSTSQEQDGIDSAAKVFKTKYPNATVDVIQTPWGAGGAAMREKELIMVSGGNPPDVGKMIWGKEFFRQGLLLDITEQVQQLPTYKNLTQGQIDRMTYNGRIFGLTTGNNCIYMYYNKDILNAVGFEGAPETIEDVEAIARKIKELDIKSSNGNTIYTVSFEGGNWFTDYWLWAGGGEQMNEDFTKTLIASPESIAAFQRMQDYVVNGWAPKIDGTNAQLWLNGQIAIYFSGDWDLPATQEAGINFGVGVLPMGVNGKNYASIGGAEFCIFKDTKHPEEAFEFLKCYYDPAFIEDWAGTTGRGITDLSLYDAPTFQSAWAESGLLESRMAMKEQLASTRYNFLESPFVFADGAKIYADALERILVKLDPVQETMEKAAEAINAGIAAENEEN